MEKGIRREIERLASGNLIQKNARDIDDWEAEMIRKKFTHEEVVHGVNVMLDSRPQFQVKVTDLSQAILDRRRRQESEKKPEFLEQAGKMPTACRMAIEFLAIDNPTWEDREKVVEAHRREVERHPKGSTLREEWTKAGLTWSRVRIEGGAE